MAVLTCLSAPAVAPGLGLRSPGAFEPGHRIVAWDATSGLPESSATCLAQAPDGHLWFGTFQGLVRFDGVAFQVFHPRTTPDFPGDGVVNLHLDRESRLWVSTYKGLLVGDAGGRSWRTWTSADGWTGDFARTFAEREAGGLLITTFDGRILEFADSVLTTLPAPPGEPERGYLGGVDDEGFWWAVQNRFVGRWENGRWARKLDPGPSLGADAVGCAPARDGGLWLLLGRDLVKWKGGSEVGRVGIQDSPGPVWSMYEDRQGSVWIASFTHGFSRIFADGSLRRWDADAGVSDHGRCVFEDREGNLWLGSSGDGLARLTPSRFEHFRLAWDRRGGVVHGLWPEPDGSMWVASYGHGLLRLGDGGVFEVALDAAALGTPLLQSVLRDRAGRLWIGTMGKGLRVLDQGQLRSIGEEQLGSGNVIALFEDSAGRIWASGGDSVAWSSDGGRFNRVTTDQGLPGGEVRCFGEDADGAVWLAHASGVYRGGAGHRFVEVTGPGEAPLGDISCILGAADGSVWFGSSRDGLLRWKEGRVHVLDGRSGYPAGAVDGLVMDERGYLWMPSGPRMVRAHTRDLHAWADGRATRIPWQVLDASDGLPRLEFVRGRQPNCSRDARGRLWFATTKGVVRTDPAGLRRNEVAPLVQITSVAYQAVGGQAGLQAGPAGQGGPPSTASAGEEGSLRVQEPIRLTPPWTAPLLLPPGLHQIEIHCSAPNFSAPERTRYRMSLAGPAMNWRSEGSRRVASFGKLPPGSYAFRVEAANSDGVWSREAASLSFSIQPFYWQTLWFRSGLAVGLVSVGAATAGWGLRRRHRRQIEALDRDRRHRDELAHFGRVSALGQLSASIAHELSQPLGAIGRNADAARIFLGKETPDLEELRSIVADIRDDNLRARRVVERLRGLLRRRESEAAPLEVAAVVRDTLRLLRHEVAARGVHVAVAPSGPVPLVRGDRVQLQQVLLNLLMNAVDAVEARRPGERRVSVGWGTVREGVEVWVEDNGTGIPEGDLQAIFEPFRSTKAEGLGMGLTIARTLVEAHQGRIEAMNLPRGGARFRFILPDATSHERRTGHGLHHR